MCLATVYKKKKSQDSLICEYVSKVDIDSSTIKLTDIMNNITSINGSLKEIDLEKNYIIIEPSN